MARNGRDGFVILKKDSPFYEIFPNGEVPVMEFLIPQIVRLEDRGEEEAYMLDVERCETEQLAEIARTVAAKFSADPSDVMSQILRDGLPIRASQVEMPYVDAVDLRMII
jgi:hypothetical protein